MVTPAGYEQGLASSFGFLETYPRTPKAGPPQGMGGDGSPTCKEERASDMRREPLGVGTEGQVQEASALDHSMACRTGKSQPFAFFLFSMFRNDVSAFEGNTL